MVFRKHFVWLLIAALACACVSSEASAKWATKSVEHIPSPTHLGPGGDNNAGPGPAGGADPDEPLGPERMAGTRVESPAQPSQTTWQRLIVALVRLDWVHCLSR